MAEQPNYAIIGRGRWAGRMKTILEGENRRVVGIEGARRRTEENEETYQERLRTCFVASGAQVAWLCVPPGDHLPAMIRAAVDTGLHAVVEKPWLCPAEETHHLQTFVRARQRVVAVHYEYCLLTEVGKWRREWNSGRGLRFGGRLNIQRPDHLGLSALDNLGSHLFSLHEYSAGDAEIVEIECEYEKRDERRVWLAREDARVAEIDLLANKEPVIQRFIASVEAAIAGEEFPFGLDFALRVAERAAAWKKTHTQR